MPTVVFYPELTGREPTVKSRLLVKRVIDLFGSIALLTLLSPLLLVIAVLVKLTSPGPVLFRQRRLGQFGRPFCFLKFRSMYDGADEAAHRDYIDKFMSHMTGQEELGRILRKTSLDELPQLINVLHGEMSLVGPRPPIPYEVERDEPWQCARLLGPAPGLIWPSPMTARFCESSVDGVQTAVL